MLLTLRRAMPQAHRAGSRLGSLSAAAVNASSRSRPRARASAQGKARARAFACARAMPEGPPVPPPSPMPTAECWGRFSRSRPSRYGRGGRRCSRAPTSPQPDRLIGVWHAAPALGLLQPAPELGRVPVRVPRVAVGFGRAASTRKMLARSSGRSIVIGLMACSCPARS